jgi:DNA-binding response OmpR family regulator
MLGPTYHRSIVLVHAEHPARGHLAAALGEAGYGVGAAASGLAGVAQALEEACDAVVVAFPLPDLRPGQFLGMLRAVGDLPVVAIAGEGVGVVEVLDAGADDVVAAPADAGEIAARLRAVLRRTAGSSDEAAPLRIGGLEIDPGAREASVDGRAVELSRREFDLLLALARRPNRVVSKRELMSEVWEQPYGGADKTVDVHLSWLRRKLGESAAEPRYLRTVRGVGIKLINPAG